MADPSQLHRHWKRVTELRTAKSSGGRILLRSESVNEDALTLWEYAVRGVA